MLALRLWLAYRLRWIRHCVEMISILMYSQNNSVSEIQQYMSIQECRHAWIMYGVNRMCFDVACSVMRRLPISHVVIHDVLCVNQLHRDSITRSYYAMRCVWLVWSIDMSLNKSGSSCLVDREHGIGSCIRNDMGFVLQCFFMSMIIAVAYAHVIAKTINARC